MSLHHTTLVSLIAALTLTACMAEPVEGPDTSTEPAPDTALVTQQQELFFHPPAPAPDCEPQRVLRDDLRAPLRVELTPWRNLLISEGGSFAANNQGRISRVSPDGVERTTILDGLPSAISTDGVPSGPSGLDLLGSKRLYVVIGRGDVTVGGAFPGQDIPNPNGPASPLFSSVLRFDFTKRIDTIDQGFTFSEQEIADLAAGHVVTKSNGPGNRVRARLVGDLEDLEEIPGKGLVPGSPLGIQVIPFGPNKGAYVTDSSRNSLEKIDLQNGDVTRVVEFPEIANPLPFGPPTLEAVPTSVRFYQGDLLSSLERGFPFPPGATTIEANSLQDLSQQSTFIGGLTQALDFTIDRSITGDSFYVVELSTNLLAQPFPEPGRLLRFDDPAGSPVVLSESLGGPAGVAYDKWRRNVYITEAFTSNVVVVDEVCAESKLP